MVRKGRIPIKLDIVGLVPSVFEVCVRQAHALVESRGKSRAVSTRDEITPEDGKISDSDLELYRRIAEIILDFQRAYGSSVEVRVFERSANRILNMIMRTKNRSGLENPEFFVNGVKVFVGVPNSFSELDEAIDRAFGKTRV